MGKNNLINVTRKNFFKKIYKIKLILQFMNFIKKIMANQVDNLVHLQFQKFSRGEFNDRAVLKVKKRIRNWDGGWK